MQNIGIGTFRKNVMKTVASKSAKLGLRTASKNTIRTNINHAAVALKKDIGVLLKDLTPYVLGMQFSEEMKSKSFVVMGDIAYDLTILCRILKVKMPTATKKVKLVGTRTAGLMNMDNLATDLLALAQESLFAQPKMKVEKKMVTMPNKQVEGKAAKEEREVEVVDNPAENELEKQRQEKMKSLLAGVVDTFWRLCFDMFKEPPVKVLDAKIEQMQKQFPNVEFDLSEGEEEQKEEQKEEQAPVQATA